MGPFGALVLCFFVLPSNKKSPPSWSCPKWKDVNVIFFLNNSFTSCGRLKMLIRSKNSMYILMDMFKNIRHFSAWLWTFQFLVIFLSYIQYFSKLNYEILQSFHWKINLQHGKGTNFFPFVEVIISLKVWKTKKDKKAAPSIFV